MEACEVLIKTKELNRDQWLEVRKLGIGGSEASIILGINKYSSPMWLYLYKIGAIENNVESECAYWGTTLEDIVAKEFEIRTGLKVHRKNAILKNKLFPFMIANLDRLIYGKQIGFEAKTCNEYVKGDWEGDSIPESYYCQCQHYMAVTGYEQWYIAVLIGGNKFKYQLIERDDEYIGKLIEKELEFWQRIEQKNPPPLNGSECDTKLLLDLYGNVVKEKTALSDDVNDMLLKREELADKIKIYDNEKNEIENQIKGMLQNNDTGMTSKYTVTWKEVLTNRLDSKKFKEEHEDLYKQYTNISKSRKFGVKELKAK